MPFTYTIDIGGKAEPQVTLALVENTIPDEADTHMEDHEEKFRSFTGMITTAPTDFITGKFMLGKSEAVLRQLGCLLFFSQSPCLGSLLFLFV